MKMKISNNVNDDNVSESLKYEIINQAKPTNMTQSNINNQLMKANNENRKISIYQVMAEKKKSEMKAATISNQW